MNVRTASGETLELRFWGGRTLTVFGSILLAVVGAVIFAIREQQQQNDELIDHQRRIIVLEGLAKANTEGRVRMETNQQFMMDDLKAIKDLIQKHDASTRRTRE